MTNLTPAEMVEQYIKLRDYKKKAEDEFELSLERVRAGMGKLESMMLDHLNKTGATSLQVKGTGTVFKNTQHSVTVEDPLVFREWLQNSGTWDAADLRANKKVARELLDKGTPLPGVKVTSVITVGVRRG